MKIVLVHNFYQQRGGEDVVVEQEAELLEAGGHTVIPYFQNNTSIEQKGRFRLARQTLWNAQAQADLADLLHRERPDIVHAHNTFPLISPAIFSASWAAGVPSVQTLHNYRLMCPAGTFVRDGSICEKCLGRAIPWPAVRYSCYRGDRGASAVAAGMLALHDALGTYTNKVDRFIALTNFAKNKFVEGGFPKDKISVRPNYLLRDPGVGDGDGNYFLYLGRLSTEKGLAVLMEAWKRLPLGGPELRIAGTGPLMPLVEQAAARNSNISVLGALEPAAAREELKGARALLFPSVNYEGFGMSIVEAMAVGTPVIASKLGSIREIVQDHVSGLHVEAGNPDAWASTIAAVAADPDILLSMRAGARHQYENKYTSEAALSELVKIYRTARNCSASDRQDSPV